MSGFTVKLEGFDEALKKLDVSKLKSDIQDELNAFGLDVEQDAKQLAPVDEGRLKNAIYWKPVTEAGKISVEVGCAVDYAAYLEFGTRKFAAAYVGSLPTDWKVLAAQYKGKGGGSFHDMVVALTQWVLRKGISATKTKSGNNSKSQDSLEGQYRAAYNIAKWILINGIKPHPFLFPAVEKNRTKLLDRLKILLNGK
jgi:HK97 gp10 family phage protein